MSQTNSYIYNCYSSINYFGMLHHNPCKIQAWRDGSYN